MKQGRPRVLSVHLRAGANGPRTVKTSKLTCDTHQRHPKVLQ